MRDWKSAGDNPLTKMIDNGTFDIIARQVIATVLKEDFQNRKVKHRHVILLITLIYYLVEECRLEELNYTSLYRILRECEGGGNGENGNAMEVILDNMMKERPDSFSAKCYKRFRDKYSVNEQWIAACHCYAMCKKALNKNKQFLGLITNNSNSLVNQEYFKKIMDEALKTTGIPLWHEFEYALDGNFIA